MIFKVNTLMASQTEFEEGIDVSIALSHFTFIWFETLQKLYTIFNASEDSDHATPIAYLIHLHTPWSPYPLDSAHP